MSRSSGRQCERTGATTGRAERGSALSSTAAPQSDPAVPRQGAGAAAGLTAPRSARLVDKPAFRGDCARAAALRERDAEYRRTRRRTDPRSALRRLRQLRLVPEYFSPGSAARSFRPGSASSISGRSAEQLGPIDQLKRVRLPRGARPPGRGPRCTSSTGARMRRAHAGGADPPSRQRPRSADDERRRPRRRTARPRSASTSSGSPDSPRRCTASETSASSRLASRLPARSASVPTSRSACRLHKASQAPSSSAAQSCSPPPNGTKTPTPRPSTAPPRARRRPLARGRARRRRRSAAVQRRLGGASSRTSSTS